MNKKEDYYEINGWIKIKEYEHFVLWQRKDSGLRECFFHGVMPKTYVTEN